ncbi:hypothetical protein EJ08DRAFT_153305 [Tothia fuscella]|uniref:RRM domain-containing protein n=1 Tax=Tothia fuscella TaxID=1048955 RepID=A0A9P4P1N8_9PEZI|nr:hypothetical protein EJ08DRAFT_153305 [Tothia fuscella]
MSTTETKVKKEKEEKSRKTKKIRVEAPEIPQEPTEKKEVEDASSDAEPKEKKRKRKRETISEEELEIDVSLPEPLSKKAARKAKKSKTTTTEDDDETTSKPAEETKQKPEQRTKWGIWIGNLPWTATKQDLRDFLCATATIKPTEITRIHMPAPNPRANATPRPGEAKQQNKGFAYVDFDSPEGLEEALKISETAMDSTHRKVLIKNSNSFEGRPEPKPAGEGETKRTDLKVNSSKPPSKRIFVGNLGFDTTKQDLEEHFGQCGAVVDVHMATFEDSGKCKGFAWVTFDSEDASTSAVNGYIYKKPADLESDDDEDEASEEEGSDAKGKKKAKKVKPHKWYVNKLQGRMLRCEFAEDPQTRYKKRYGKDAPSKKGEEVNVETGQGEVDENTTAAAERPAKAASTPHDRRREARRAQNNFHKVDARTIKPGAALAHAQRATGAIVEGTGSKISFD